MKAAMVMLKNTSANAKMLIQQVNITNRATIVDKLTPPI